MRERGPGHTDWSVWSHDTTAMTTRRQILESASRLLHARGYRATTMDAVVQECGVSKGAVYHHFRTKEDLFEAALDDIFSTFGHRFQDAMRGIDDPLERLIAMMRAMGRIQRETGLQGCPLGNLALELGESDARLRHRVDRMLELLSRQILGCLRQARERGILRPEVEIEPSSRFLLASLEGSILLARSHDDLDMLEELIGQAQTYVETLRSDYHRNEEAE